MDLRVFDNRDVTELYLTALPAPGADAASQARDLFGAVRDALTDAGAALFQERIFVAESAVQETALARAAAYGDLADGVPPAWLCTESGQNGPIAGVQVHAVRTPGPLERIRIAGNGCGRIAHRNGRAFVSMTAVSAPDAGSPAGQARAMLEGARTLLRHAGGDMADVVRTWMWLEDILSWYGPFNEVRSAFFHECGMLNGSRERPVLPASTGMGVGPAGKAACAMDLVAVAGDPSDVRYHVACGNQRAACDYGSAFSRAATAPTPAGRAVYVSGTAAINAAGETVFRDDADAQADETITNVRAVLADLGCGDDDVVQAIVYCKTPEVQRQFLSRGDALPWPHFTAVGPVCRDDLLVEIECTAVRGA